MALMGLDVGSSGCKCMVFTDDGHPLSSAYEAYEPEHPAEGCWEMNPEAIWNAVKRIIWEAVRHCSGEPITALSISSFGEAAVPLDRYDRILHNSLLYSDQRGAAETQELIDRLGRSFIMSLTGLSAHPMYTIGKMMWLKRTQPELFRQIDKIMLYGDFIAYQLTGDWLIDYSLASRTMAFNIVKCDWEPLLLEAAGLEAGMFAKAVRSGVAIGSVRRNIADELGLSDRTIVVAGGHDQACATVGAGILSEGVAVNGIGTVECVTPAYSRPILNESMMRHHYNCTPHAAEGLYLTYAFNFSGGSLLRWFADLTSGHPGHSRLPNGLSVFDKLEQKAPQEPTEMLVLPHFAGSGTPYMNPLSKGAIIGLTFESDAGHMYRALMEGMTYEALYNLELLEKAGIQVGKLRAVGGGARSALWLQLKADILNRSVETLQHDEAGIVGAAMLAGVAARVYPSLDAAADKLVHPKRLFEPQKKHQAYYEEQFSKYKRLYPVLQSLSREESAYGMDS